MRGHYEVRNWGKYQHKRNRKDPWFKMYWEILDPVANPDFVSLPQPARYLGMSLLCLAAKTENLIPSNPSWIGTEVGMTRAAVTKGIGYLLGIDFIRAVGTPNGVQNGTADGTEVGTEKGSPRKEREELLTNVRSSRRDEVWDTLNDLFGEPAKGTSAFGKRTKAVSDLKKSGATADTINSAYRRWGRVFEGATPTDMAIAVHYARLIHGTVHSPRNGSGVGGMGVNPTSARPTPEISSGVVKREATLRTGEQSNPATPEVSDVLGGV